MNAIHNYINALFSSLPKTPNVLRLQAEMMENMEEKYQDLLREGKSEEEAVGIVLASIGTVDDLKAGLGITDDAPGQQPTQDHTAFLTERTAFQKKFAIAITVGVVLCIGGVIASAICDDSLANDSITAITFFGPIAIAVALFVYFGIRFDWYEKQYKAIYRNTPFTEDDNNSKSLSGLVSGIIFPLAVVFYLFIGFMYGLWHPGWIIFIVCVIIVCGIEAFEAYQKKK